MTEIYDEKTLRRFLLGELGEDEQTRLENAAFADAELSVFIQTIENDLIDEYAGDELSAAEKASFERMFLTSEERLKKIEFARIFQRAGEKESSAAQSETAAPPFEKNNFWSNFFGRLIKPQLAFAALVALLLLVGAWLLLKPATPNEIAEQNNGNRIAPTPANDSIRQTPDAVNNSAVVQANNRTNDLPNRAANFNSALEKSSQNKSPNSSPAPSKVSPTPGKTESSAPTLATLVFPAGMTRDGGGKILSLKIAPNTKAVRLVFALEKGDDAFKTYRIEIKSAANDLRFSAARADRAVAFQIPAAKLPAGRYEAVLRGFNDSNEGENIGYYDFEVTRKP